MADTYDMAPDDAERLRDEFAKLMEEEAKAINTRRELARAERELVEAEAARTRQAEASADAARNAASAWRDASDRIERGIGVAGSIIRDILGGRLVAAFQSIAAVVKDFAFTPGSSSSSPGKGSGGSGMASSAFSGLATALGTAGAALEALSGAASAAYGTLAKLAGAAAPGAMTALNKAFETLWAALGQAVLPILPKLGASLMMMADEFVRIMGRMGYSSEKLNAANDRLTHSALLLNASFLAIPANLGLGLGRMLSGKSGDEARKNAEKMGIDPDNPLGSLFNNMMKYGKATGEDIGSKRRREDEQFSKYESLFIKSALMGGGQGPPRMEASSAAYERIQQAVAGVTPVDQQLLEIQRKSYTLLESWLPKIAPKEAPGEPAGGGA